jgi:peptidoglycan/LPS O-acetylase OafA/YrhL
MAPVLSVGWTLSYEMYFYLLVAVGLVFSRRRFLIGLGAFFALSVFMSRYAVGPVADVLTSNLLLEFYAGYVIGVTYTRSVKFPAWLACACIVCSIMLYCAWIAGLAAFTRILSWGLPAALLVAGSVFLEKNRRIKFPEWAMILGDSSYSLYLSHFLLLPGIGKLAAMFGLVQAVPPDVFIVFASLCCCIGGYASYRILEAPISRFFSKTHRHKGF